MRFDDVAWDISICGKLPFDVSTMDTLLYPSTYYWVPHVGSRRRTLFYQPTFLSPRSHEEAAKILTINSAVRTLLVVRSERWEIILILLKLDPKRQHASPKMIEHIMDC
jgi:hypothetical protein